MRGWQGHWFRIRGEGGSVVYHRARRKPTGDTPYPVGLCGVTSIVDIRQPKGAPTSLRCKDCLKVIARLRKAGVG